MKPNQVLIVTVDKKFSVLALAGTANHQITDGYGGFNIVSRPRRTGYVQYMGRNPFQMTISLMFDGYANDESQEDKLRVLSWMALPPSDTGSDEPRPVLLYGALPYPSSGQWVINGLSDGDATIWRDDGSARLRQDVTLTLIRHVTADSLDLLQQQASLSPSTQTPYTIKKGDTFRSIAAMYLGDPTKAGALARANGIHDLNTIGKYIGKQIILKIVASDGGPIIGKKPPQ